MLRSWSKSEKESKVIREGISKAKLQKDELATEKSKAGEKYQAEIKKLEEYHEEQVKTIKMEFSTMESQKKELVLALESDLERLKLETRYLANEININAENYNEYSNCKDKEDFIRELEEEYGKLEKQYANMVLELQEPDEYAFKQSKSDISVDEARSNIKTAKGLIKEVTELEDEKARLEDINATNDCKKEQEVNDFYSKQQIALSKQIEYKDELDRLVRELDELIDKENELQSEIQNKNSEIVVNEQEVKERIAQNKQIYEENIEANQKLIATLKKQLNEIDREFDVEADK